MPEWLRRMLGRSYRAVFASAGQTEGSPAEANVQIETASPREIETVVTRLYQLALERTPNADERQVWVREVLGQRLSVARLVETIAESAEAQLVRQRSFAADVPNGRLIQFAYERLQERSPMASEVVLWDRRCRLENLGRGQLVLQLFAHEVNQKLTNAAPGAVHDPSQSNLMGTDRSISVEEWQARSKSFSTNYEQAELKRYASLGIHREPEILVSAIASLYRGGDYIEQFMENITSQTIFRDYCELIIIDADSPENEASVIARYMEQFPNIVYHRAATRIGIYEAWNLGVQMSKGKYLTNTNLDDLRRSDSFERQVEILEKFSFVDVVYQDFYYSFDGKAPFAKTAAIDFKSELPIVTPYNLMQSNCPHNAPMWRRVLHDEIGLFDASFRSAGDFDFWLRCASAGKTFYKVNDPHVVYYVNPEGLSTQPNTRGIDEANRSTKQHGRKLLSPWLLCFDDEFVGELSRLVGVEVSLDEAQHAKPEWRYDAAQRALRLHAGASRDRSSV